MKLTRVSIRQLFTYAAAATALLLARPILPTFLVGCGLAAVGIAIRVWGCGHLRKNKELVISGPYAHVQHPLYLGTFLISIGVIVASGSPQWPAVLLWAVAGPIFLVMFFGYYLRKKKRVEGQRLAEHFGPAFVEYSKVVPPFMPSLRPYPKAMGGRWSWNTFISNHELGMDILISALFTIMWLLPRMLSWT